MQCLAAPNIARCCIEKAQVYFELGCLYIRIYLADFEVVVPAVDFELGPLTDADPAQVKLVDERCCLEAIDVIDLSQSLTTTFRFANFGVKGRELSGTRCPDEQVVQV